MISVTTPVQNSIIQCKDVLARRVARERKQLCIKSASDLCARDQSYGSPTLVQPHPTELKSSRSPSDPNGAGTHFDRPVNVPHTRARS
ncbi:hypothetical protein EVAR_32378_1 [Eumeta japonica]|uniref:Uncharacterized protein n=1 Tax=Eumeta variegata TaxID=151549 RepID=A0A4C1VKC9_EUMVA|nr:hypothetical protein EVAR_32378_1 [Eumeta japonica]